MFYTHVSLMSFDGQSYVDFMSSVCRTNDKRHHLSDRRIIEYEIMFIYFSITLALHNKP